MESRYSVDQSSSAAGLTSIIEGVLSDLGSPLHVHLAFPVGWAGAGDVGVVHDVPDELVRAAGDDQVDIFVQGQHLDDRLAGLKQLNPSFGHSRPPSPLAGY